MLWGRPTDSYGYALTIFATPRSGSSLLSALLQAHPDVAMYWEIFKALGDYPLNAMRSDPRTTPTLQKAIDRRRQAPGPLIDALLRELPGRRRVQAYKLFGFDQYFNAHLPWSVVDEQIIRASRPSRYLVLERRNVLAQYVSLLAAQQTNAWNTARTDKVKVTVNATRFATFARMHRLWYQFVRGALHAAHRPFTNLYYERDLEQQGAVDATVARMLSVLNLTRFSYAELAARAARDAAGGTPLPLHLFRKQAPAHLRESIANLQELLDDTHACRYLEVEGRSSCSASSTDEEREQRKLQPRRSTVPR